MPIDVNIPLQVQHPSMDVVGPYMQGQQNALSQQYRQQQMEQQKLSTEALVEQRNAQAEQRRRAGEDIASIDQALQPGRTRQAAIDAAPGHLKAMVAKQFDEADEASQKAKDAKRKADEADIDYAASLAAGVKPWLAQGADQGIGAARIALAHAEEQGHDVSEIKQYLDQNPQSLPQIIDGLIARSPKYSALLQKEQGGYTLGEGQVRFDNNGKEMARGPAKAEKPSGKWVPDYDETGKPIERWVADGPGATAPRQEAPVVPQRPIVVAPGSKAVDPATGQTVAEGNPIERPEPQPRLTVLGPGAKAVDATGATIAEGNAPPSRAADLARVDTTNDAGQNVTRFVQPAAGLEVPKPTLEAPAPTRPRQVAPGSREAYFIAYAHKLGKRPDDLTIDEQGKALQAFARADDKPSAAALGGSSDVKEAVSAMKEGTVPPQLPGRASKEYLAVMAEARRQGYDLSSAATDWTATQKHIATLNGSQQTRLRQAVDNTYHSLDVIEDLAKKWDGGKFPILNRAGLTLAKSGTLGQDVQQVAVALEAQISDVTAELGNVYMGGNSPTDHSLELASKNLQADWSKKTLLTMIEQARRNLTIRQNSIKNAGVVGASPTNPYAPQETVATPAKPSKASDPLGIR